MKFLKWTSLIALAAAFLVAGPVPGKGAPAADPALTAPAAAKAAPGLPLLLVEPGKIGVGFWYRHAEVTVRAVLPAGCDAALIVVGPEREREMNVKGRSMGLWMTVGKARFSKVPAFYKYLTTRPLNQMVSPEVADANLLGYDALNRLITVTSDVGDPQTHKREYLGLMEGQGLFENGEGALKVTRSNHDSTEVEGQVVLPDLAPQGEYRVIVLAIKEGVLQARTEKGLTVELGGGPAFIHRLAFQHGWWYGIIAVVVALAAGLGVGLIFPSGGGH
jgi:uncharacterized protein (TIGR02186 family)